MASLATTSSLAKALEKMLATGAPTHVWLDPKLGLVVGSFPAPHSWFDFAKETFDAVLPPTSTSKEAVNLLGRAKRVSQIYEIETKDTIYKVGSATQALIEGLNLIERHVPGTIAKLSLQKKRTKRPVAQNRSELYDNPGSEKYSSTLQNGYFVATNNKTSESIGILREALKLAGPWGKTVTLRKR